MHTSTFLKAAPLLLTATFVFCAARTAHAQEFTFTAPTTSDLTVHPGDTILFSGSLHNDQIEQIDDVTIGLSNGYPGKFTFSSPFFFDLARNQTRNFTGTLKVSSTATFNPTFFELDASGTGDSTGESYDLISGSFKISLASAAVPEASSLVSLGLLLGGLSVLGICRRRPAALRS